MKIAIVEREGSFSERWIRYCEKHDIGYKIVDPYKNDIIQQVADCDAFMWHFHQADYRAMQMAVAVLTSIQKSGKKVYPDPDTCWHFDNKVSEKYLLEAVGAPLVPTHVFYTKSEAIEWINNNSFPKVFKLKGGAGASNVRLARTKKDALHLVNRAFGKGFSQYNWTSHFKEQWRKYSLGKATLRELLRPCYYALRKYPNEFAHYHQNEIGYVYFQDFIPNNDFDIRVCIVDNKAFAIRRNCRKNDFRASGSGSIVHDIRQIDQRCVKIAFEVNSRLKCQSAGYDFVFDSNGNPLIVECGYGFTAKVYDACEGYWTEDLAFHPGKGFDFCGWMVEGIINDIENGSK